MTSRERVGKALRHQRPDRVPFHESFWEATVNRWHREGLPADVPVDEYFDTEFRYMGVDNSFGYPYEVIERTDEYVIVRDDWGVVKRDWSDHRSTPELMDFAIKSKSDWDREKRRLTPDPARVDWEEEKRRHQAAREQGKFLCISAVPGYEATWRKVGVEGILMAIVEDPNWVREMYEYDANMIIGMAQLYFDRGFVFDGAWLYDDLGYKNALLFSPKAYREQLFPYHTQLCDFFHAHDCPVVLHSCGRVLDLIPMLIEAGFDCLQPLEVKAGMDLGLISKEYGKQLALMGGVDVRTWFDEVDESVTEKEVRTKLAIGMASAGGYLFHSDHSVPTQVSFERFCKVVNLVRKYGVYE